MSLRMNHHFEECSDAPEISDMSSQPDQMNLVEGHLYDDAFERACMDANYAKNPDAKSEIKENEEPLKKHELSSYKKGDMQTSARLFESIAKENPEYGEGGGRQYFVQDASDLKESGQLLPQNCMTLTMNPSDKISHIENAGLDDEELRYLDENTPTIERQEDITDEIEHSGRDEQGGYSIHLNNGIDDEELRYLDENTPAVESLTRVEEGQTHEDYRHPLGNQEDSRGLVNPDAWSDPRDIRDGEELYQISPVFSDGSTETKSSYFTDQKTIDSCRSKDGQIDLSKLLEKLQVPPKKDVSADGEESSNIVISYQLTKYRYQFD